MVIPVVDLKGIGQDAQSDSKNAQRPEVIIPGKKRHRDDEELMYLRTLADFMLCSFGFASCLLCWFAAYVITGQVTVRKTSFPTIDQYVDGSRSSLSTCAELHPVDGNP